MWIDYLFQIYKSLLIHNHISYNNLQKCADVSSSSSNNINDHQDNHHQIINYECNKEYLFNIKTHKTNEIINIILKDSYNLILTTSYMMIIPRSKKAFHFNNNNNGSSSNNSSSSSHYHQDTNIISDDNDKDNKDVIEINSLGFLGLFLLKQFKHVHHLQQLSLFDVLFHVGRKIYTDN